MSHYSRLLAKALIGQESNWVKLIYNASPMHDIGKIGIPDIILLKEGKLTEEEFEKIKEHPQIGANIIGEHKSELLQMAKSVALNHHEKFDGSGYPNGLIGEQIPLEARIVAIADVFDALTTKRPYKEPWSVEDALNYLKTNAGIHFDPQLVVLFEKILPQVLEIKNEFAEK